MPAAIIPLITTAISLGASAVAKRKAKKSEALLEGMTPPAYKANQSIVNYYDKALQRYNTNITDTAEYKMNNQNIKQGTVQGLSTLNKLRSGNVAGLIQNQNNALLGAAVAGERRKIQEFNVLGQATGMKAGEGQKEFQYNQIAPFEQNYNLLAMKAGNQRQVQNQSMQNAYNNANAAASILAGGDKSGFGDIFNKSSFGNSNLISKNTGSFNLFNNKIAGTNINKKYGIQDWYQTPANRSNLLSYTT